MVLCCFALINKKEWVFKIAKLANIYPITGLSQTTMTPKNPRDDCFQSQSTSRACFTLFSVKSVVSLLFQHLVSDCLIELCIQLSSSSTELKMTGFSWFWPFCTSNLFKNAKLSYLLYRVYRCFFKGFLKTLPEWSFQFGVMWYYVVKSK